MRTAPGNAMTVSRDCFRVLSPSDLLTVMTLPRADARDVGQFRTGEGSEGDCSAGAHANEPCAPLKGIVWHASLTASSHGGANAATRFHGPFTVRNGASSAIART
jgi:hypothetical protein